MKKNQIGGAEINPIVMIVGLFLLLTLIWIYYRKIKNYVYKKKHGKWPPHNNACPDYWVNNGNNICINSHEVGLLNCPVDGITTAPDPSNPGKSVQAMDFSGILYQKSNSNSNYNKCIFSKRCQAPWTGIDNLCA